MRTETTINNTCDFAVGRLNKNLPELRRIGFAANHRVLEVEKLSHDSRVGAAAFERLQKPPTTRDGQRASALRFGDERVQAILAVILLLCLQFERVPKTHRYRMTEKGLATALFYQRLYARMIRPGLSIIEQAQMDNVLPTNQPPHSPAATNIIKLSKAIDQYIHTSAA